MAKMKRKLLIFQNDISSYSVPVYNIIAERYDLTVAYYNKDKSKEDCHFNKIQLRPICFKNIRIVKGVYRLAKLFDVVSFLPDLHTLSYWTLPFLPRRFKVVSWSIGFRCSYKHPYDVHRKHTFLDHIFLKILSRCDTSIFYMEKAKEFWSETKLDLDRIFVAPNTTKVLPLDKIEKEKQDFLFVGTLYKGKGLDNLLNSFYEAVVAFGIHNQLHIIGEGSERIKLEEFVTTHQLNDKVFFHGAIYDEKQLASYFSKSLICISPTQAGLSVPKSMGYSVPFVTRRDAITGGELYHITPGKNGVLYDNDVELVSILVDASNNPTKYLEMGASAKRYYDNYATVANMARGALSAFDYAINK